MIKARKEIENIIPYKPGRPIADVKREYGLDRVIKLASNENPLGTSDRVKEAVKNFTDGNLNIYPDGACLDLRKSLADFLDVNMENIVCSNGADEMLELVARTYLEEGDEVIVSAYTFSRYTDASTIMGAKINVIPTTEDYRVDLKAHLDKINERTKLIWLCNPNNPTGSCIKKDELLDFIENIPDHVLLVYDQAYHDFVTDEDYLLDAQKLPEKYKNVLVIRTFSKVYGLAGLRSGYAIGDERVIRDINQVCPPFNVNSLSQIASIEALKDQDFVERGKKNNREQREYLYEALSSINVKHYPSQANFILFEVEKDAQEVFVEMQKRGVIIRPMGEKLIRVSVGLPEENQLFIEKLKEVLEK